MFLVPTTQKPMKRLMQKTGGYWLALGAFLTVTASAHAADPTDIDGVITALGAYKTPAIALAIAILLFVIGRKVVRKLI